MKRTIIFAVCILLSHFSVEKVNAAITEATDLTYILRKDGRISFCSANNLIAFDQAESDYYYKIWTMDKDGKNPTPLTVDNPILPNRHHGNPDWHPSGEFMAIQVVNPDIGGIFSGTFGYKLYTSPGAGVQNDVWILKRDGSAAWKITNVTNQGGVLHPHFSKDGSKLVWAEMISPYPSPTGTWVMKLGNFSVVGGVPVVSNIITLKPGNYQWYETHGFSPDGSTLIFSIMPWGGASKDFDICTYNLVTAELRMLTEPTEQQWDEHAHFTPDGKQVIWMSSAENHLLPEEITQTSVKTDYWIMNADGSNKKRLTFFNIPTTEKVIASDLSITDDGRYMYGYIQNAPGTILNQGAIIRLKLVNPDTDDDGLLDDWEMSSFANLNHTSDEDADGDQFTNLQEFSGGTNPADAKDRLAISDQTISSTGFTVQWNSVLGKTYRIEYSSNMKDWTTALNNWTATTVSSSWTDDGTMTRTPPSLAQRRFYRVVALP
jgi:Tol biopolymer transport system component